MKKNSANTHMLLFITLFSSFYTFLNTKLTYGHEIAIQAPDKIDNKTIKLELAINLQSDEEVYENSINISTDNPAIELSPWQANITPSKSFNNSFKEGMVFNKSFNITVNAQLNAKNTIEVKDNTKKTNIYVSYLLLDSKKMESIEKTFSLDLFKSALKPESSKENEPTTTVPLMQTVTQNEHIKENPDHNIKSETKSADKSVSNYLAGFSAYIQKIIKENDSIGWRLFFVLILGLLMSFTPCIYPMIPITVGILQNRGSKSIAYNLFISLCYACGIATTFALFGLTAAFTGNLLGQILVNPFFVLFIVAVLVYLALSMFGFYEMYIPRSLQSSATLKHKGSPVSAFIFGAISGSFASPCLSPGLALLLTIVATLGNKFLGFILLFSFGIGLSIPLILIGTFSSSINILPKTGMWMEEIKKLFGFLLLGMCFFYLNNILPFFLLLLLIAICLLMTGIYYLTGINSYDSRFLKYFKNIMGISLIASSIFIFAKSYQTVFHAKLNEDTLWSNKYDSALENALNSNKLLLIDVGASFCTLCKAIDKHVFGDMEVRKQLAELVPVKVDATDPKSEPYISLKNKYKIIGVPTILIINPKNGELLKRWEGELYDIPKAEVIAELKKLINIK